ncbi:MAG: UMP kinase [Lentisphaerae bacterium]|jgi:uridylate kinase|nr:UMP kinase [Lentisphaerota bacterium]MBT4820794.1 UMP kinase [Lentisphaerota bacterium]MBT5610161.1 UMP kinase [Lentisphaerota bacterium]MBT7057106.1 UMP kinase [Lentisphaerota bacterium]MBT7846171.1 UMP kinase [Lentisphaerota bacterium]
MRSGPVFERILLKLSGELLQGAAGSGLDPAAISLVAERVKEAADYGVQIGLVIGAGNLFRGLPASRDGMNRCSADSVGMLATVMNALAMRDALEAAGLPTEIQSAIAMTGIVDPFDVRRALDHLENDRAVIFAGGTGHPFFSTDTTAALRACQVRASAVLKATKVDGVYTADPKTDPTAARYRRISYGDALKQRLSVMDSTAFSLCMDNSVPILVFDFSCPNVLRDIVRGDLSGATLVDDGPTELDV